MAWPQDRPYHSCMSRDQRPTRGRDAFDEAPGPRELDLAGMDPGDFEEIAHRLVRVTYPSSRRPPGTGDFKTSESSTASSSARPARRSARPPALNPSHVCPPRRQGHKTAPRPGSTAGAVTIPDPSAQAGQRGAVGGRRGRFAAGPAAPGDFWRRTRPQTPTAASTWRGSPSARRLWGRPPQVHRTRAQRRKVSLILMTAEP